MDKDLRKMLARLTNDIEHIDNSLNTIISLLKPLQPKSKTFNEKI
jgi:hypothetical protein